MVSIAFVGPGNPKVPVSVILDGIKDILVDPDVNVDDIKPTFLLPWYGVPNSNLEALYDFTLDENIPFKMFYEGTPPPPVFDDGEVISSSDIHVSMAAESPTAVLALYGEDHDEVSVYVLDVLDHSSCTRALDLTNGLVPIAVTGDEPEEEAAPEPEPEADDDTMGELDGFTREELEGLSLKLLKRAAQGRTSETIRDRDHAIDILLGDKAEAEVAPDPQPSELEEIMKTMRLALNKLEALLEVAS